MKSDIKSILFVNVIIGKNQIKDKPNSLAFLLYP